MRADISGVIAIMTTGARHRHYYFLARRHASGTSSGIRFRRLKLPPASVDKAITPLTKEIRRYARYRLGRWSHSAPLQHGKTARKLAIFLAADDVWGRICLSRSTPGRRRNAHVASCCKHDDGTSDDAGERGDNFSFTIRLGIAGRHWRGAPVFIYATPPD